MRDPPDDEVYVSPVAILFIYPHPLDYIELENEWISKVELAFYPRRAIRDLASSR